jgi:hypothetical protein
LRVAHLASWAATVDISGNGNTPTHVSDSLNLAHQWQWFVAVSG